MKKRILAFAIFSVCLFVCGCTLNTTINGDAYTDFSSNISSQNNINSFFDEPISQIVESSSKTSSVYTNQSSKQSDSSLADSTSSVNTKTNSFKSSSNKSSKKEASISSNSAAKLSTIKVTNSNKSSFKTVGRCDTGSSKGLALAWGGSSIEFSLICQGEISLSFSFENSIEPVYIRVELDNKPIHQRLEVSYNSTITIDTAPSIEHHNIKIIRLSDCEASPLVLESILTYGSLADTPPLNSSIYIEAIGSNNFCGRGLLLKNSQNTYTESEINDSSFADTTLTYPYLASNLLKADCYLLARKISGFVATNVLQTQTINNKVQRICDPSFTLTQLYTRINIHNQKEYTPQRKPDILIIDAGELDSNLQLLNRIYLDGRIGISPNKAAYLTADFLNSLKASNPKLKIVWCYGMTSANKDYISFIHNVIEIIDNNSNFVYTLCLPKANNTNFPTADEHNNAAKLLYKKLKSIV